MSRERAAAPGRPGISRVARAGGGAGLAVAAAAAVLAGCGGGQQPPAGQQTAPASPAATSPPAGSGTGSAGMTSTTQPSAAAGQPAGGPVPRHFAATSVTFVSPSQAFVLGTAPCAAAPCTSVVRTTDRGRSWRGLPAPRVPVGQPMLSRAPAVWGIRFATPRQGFVFGTGLWQTTDGGAHWSPAAAPGGAILSLAAIDGQVLAVTARCTPQAGCGQHATLVRRPLAGGPWQVAARISNPRILDPTSVIATQARVAALVDGSHVLVTGNGGVTVSRHPTPCTSLAPGEATSVAVTSPLGLALLCTGQGAMGHTGKQVYVSGDGGVHWAKAGQPGTAGDGGTISAPDPAHLTIATASAASWLYYSGDSAARWRDCVTEPDGGMGWADLGFATATQGVVVHGPAVTDGNREHRPGQLLLTGDGGASWQLARF